MIRPREVNVSHMSDNVPLSHVGGDDGLKRASLTSNTLVSVQSLSESRSAARPSHPRPHQHNIPTARPGSNRAAH